MSDFLLRVKLMVRNRDRRRMLHRVCALFGASACIACLSLTVHLLVHKCIMLEEPRRFVLAFELLVAVVGVFLNLCVFVRGGWD